LLLDPDDLDAAVIGVLPRPAGPVFVYDAELLVERLAATIDAEGLDEDADDPEETPEGQAWLHLQTDILRWHAQQGARAPIILQAITDDNPATDDDVLIDYAGRSWVVLAQPGT